ncbi:LysE family translocator [Vibrio sp. SS-MA-C1-2]|uniref:LysE family translocator n=1 Tax=Vibrio sp. SS-MA-C1-2 TaxID=2908646 RepID=UPI001F363A99|nr:LysE family translocator [Vibrio sp. SS-MA-C1-2]UJF17973.1 LysE family translocator [Vibrio sp. SS-MA-C1-2]
MNLFLIWISAMFPLVFSPGPANIVFASSGAKVGLKRSLPLLIGIDATFFIKSIVIGFGLGEVVKTQPQIMNMMQLLGAIYLIYLAIKMMRRPSSNIGEVESLSFRDGVIVQLLNSKGWLLVLMMFTLFSVEANQIFGEQGVYVLILWLFLLNISAHVGWIHVGILLAKLSQNSSYQKGLNIFYGSCLILVSGWLLIDNSIWLNIL